MSDEPFPWKDEYAVGIPILDADHKELFNIVGDLRRINELSESQPQTQLNDLIDRLMHYVQEHFEREEHLMAESDYPKLKDHRHKHHDFMRVIYALHKIEEESPEHIDLIKLQAFLESWLKRHILQADHDYIPYVKSLQARRKSDGMRSLQDAYENQGEEQTDDFVSITVQVPYYASNSLRRCARMLRNGGDEAKAIEAASDPVKLMNMDDALLIAKVITK